MAIASDDDGMAKMFSVQDNRWASTKRAAFSADMPSDVAVGQDGLDKITVDPSKHSLDILTAPTVRSPRDCAVFTMKFVAQLDRIAVKHCVT